MKILSCLRKLFNFKPRFNGTPEMFLALVEELQRLNNPVYSAREVVQWGNVMQKVVNVDLKPYKDFTDLVINGVPDTTVIKKLKAKMGEIRQRTELKKAIYGEYADLGDDDVIKSDSKDAISARGMVKDLSKYLIFPEEEKKKIDRF